MVEAYLRAAVVTTQNYDVVCCHLNTTMSVLVRREICRERMRVVKLEHARIVVEIERNLPLSSCYGTPPGLSRSGPRTSLSRFYFLG